MDKRGILGWYDDLPWWLKVASIGAGGIVKAWASTLPSPYSDLLSWLSVAFVVATVVGLALHAVRGMRGGKKVGPYELIIVGLGGLILSAAITLTGVVWNYRASQNSTTIAIQSAGVASAPIKSKPRYTRVALEGRQKSLEELTATINKIDDEVTAAKSPIFDNWPTALPLMGLKVYADKVDELRALMDGANDTMNATVAKQGYADLPVLPALPIAEIDVALDVWSDRVRAIPEGQASDRPFDGKPGWFLYVGGVNKFMTWVKEVRGTIAAKRAEYDAAEVQ